MRIETTVGLTIILAATGLACSHAPPPQPVSRPPVAEAPPPPPPAPKTEAPAPEAVSSDEDAIYFNYDAALIRADAQTILQQVARRLQLYPNKKVRIEGNCDERGTTEYNLALGESRARAAQQYLLRLGVPAKRIEIVSYGSERPRNAGHDESAWAANRRDDFRLR